MSVNKSYLSLAIFTTCMLLTASASADPTVPPKSKSGSKKTSSTQSSMRSSSASRTFDGGSSSDIKASNNQIDYQSISTNVNYTETGNGVQTTAGTLDTETGPVTGKAYYISVMTDVFLGNDYFKLSYDRSNGYTNYVGSNLNLPNGPPGPFGSVISTSNAALTNIGGRYGKGLNITGTSMLTPYIEIGTHNWYREINAGENYSHNYYGYGLLNQFALGNNFVLSIDAMVGRTVGSYIVVTSTPLITGFSTSLGDSNLYRFGVCLDYALAKIIHLNAAVDYTAFSYGISATQPSGMLEPDSSTNYITVKFGLGIGF